MDNETRAIVTIVFFGMGLSVYLIGWYMGMVQGRKEGFRKGYHQGYQEGCDARSARYR